MVLSTNNTTTSQMLYTQQSGATSSNPFVTYYSLRDPNSTDINYPIQKRWVNFLLVKEWILESFISTSGTAVANWILLTGAGAGVAVNTVTVDQAIPLGVNPVLPFGNNINFGETFANHSPIPTGTIYSGYKIVTRAEHEFGIELQLAGSNPANLTANNFGIAQFDANEFTVTNGFVRLAGGATPAILTLSDDVTTQTFPTLGNIQLVGHVVEQGATKFSTIVAGASLLNINPMSSARWIVDPLGFNGTHTTIASALTSATSGDTIQIMASATPYTENLTLKAGVNLTGLPPDGTTFINGAINTNVTIIGKCTATFTGSASFAGINFQTNSDFAISITGVNITNLFFSTCNFNGLNNTVFQHTSSGDGRLYFFNCTGNLDIAGIAYFANTRGDTQIFGGNWSNDGGSTTPSTFAATGIGIANCAFRNAITTSTSATINLDDVFVGGPIILAGTGGLNASLSQFSGGTASAITIGAGTSANIFECIVNSSNTNAITGAGAINYGNITFTGSSSLINVTTQTPEVISNDAVVIKSPGAYPYTTVPQDAVILVDTSVARTIVPLASPTKGQMHRIKDNVGSAAANNITITPSGKNIDGAASSTINTNYGSKDIVYNGTEWSVL